LAVRELKPGNWFALVGAVDGRLHSSSSYRLEAGRNDTDGFAVNQYEMSRATVATVAAKCHITPSPLSPYFGQLPTLAFCRFDAFGRTNPPVSVLPDFFQFTDI